MFEEIIEGNTGSIKRAQKLLHILPSRGPNAFLKLYEAVVTAELFDAADILMPENIPHWKKDENAEAGFGNDPAELNNEHLVEIRTSDENPPKNNEHLVEIRTSDENPPKTNNSPTQIKDEVDKNKPQVPDESLNLLDVKETGNSRDSLTCVKEIDASMKPQTNVMKSNALMDAVSNVKELDFSSESQTFKKDFYETQQQENEIREETISIDSQTLPKEFLETKVALSPDLQQFSKMTKKICSCQDNSNSLLPENWPSEKHINCNKEVITVEPNSEMTDKYIKSLSGEEIYTLKSKIRGNAVILDNRVFKFKKYRHGSKHDSQKLKTLFSQLGFEIKFHKNLTKEGMLQMFQEESQRIEPCHSCFILVILSHGCEQGVFGTDGNTNEDGIAIDSIKTLFCNVKNLYQKPKLFFVQACRGGSKDSGLMDKSSVGEDYLALEDSDNGSHIPTMSDCFVAMATTAGMISWRNTELGSWFIQALVYIFSHYSHAFDITKLLTHVNNLVSKSEANYEKHKQVSEFNVTLRKEFYFFPGLPEETF